MKELNFTQRVLALSFFALLLCQFSYGQLNVVASKKDPCAGANNGSITLTITGASGDVALTFFGPAPNPPPALVTPDVSGNATYTTSLNLKPGGYFVVAQDDDETFPPIGITLVNVAPGLTATVDPGYPQDNSSCAVPNGEIRITVVGGTGSYSYDWDGSNGFNSTLQNISGLNEQSYKVEISDQGANCFTSLGPLLIDDPSPLVQTITNTPAPFPVCLGSDLVINLSGSELFPVVYEIINATTSTPTGVTVNGTGAPLSLTLPSGSFSDGETFTVQATNQLCTPSPMAGSVTVDIVPLPTIASSSSTNVTTCFGGNNGSITVLAGGNSPFNYTLNPGAITNTTGIFTGLTAGTYTVSITDVNSCGPIVTPNIVINQPTPVSPTITPTNILCFGGTTGSINVVGAGGTGPYDFSIDGGTTFPILDAASNLYTNLAVGTYNIQLRDANNCLSAIIPVAITEPAVVGATTTASNVLCFGGNTGSINVVGTGGVGPYDFSIDGGTTFPVLDAASNLFGSLIAGTYNIQLRDANNCLSAIIPLNLTQPASAVGGTITPTNVLCFGGNTGSINVVGTGGVGPYDFSIDGGTTFPVLDAASNLFGSLIAGTYNVQVRDANNCITASIPVTLTQPTAIVPTITPTNILCFGGTTGSINVVGAGGTGPYDFSIDGGTTFPILDAASNLYTNLAVGTYNIQLRDANNCLSAIIPVAITEPAVVGATTTASNVLCFGGNTGSINVVGTGGVGPYDFSIDGGTTFPVLDAASNLFGSLIAGTYNIQLRDANNCLSAIIPLNLTQPASAVGGTITPTNVLCFGGNTGSINVVGTGGVGPYDFSIDGGTTFPVLDAASNLFGSLIAGTYNVQVRDANNCITASIPVTLTQPTAIVPTITPTNILCFGGTTGSINVVGAGGTGPYDFSIDGGTTFPILDAASNLYTNLAVGTYNIQLRDANNCLSAIIPVAITEPAVVGATTTASNVLCFGGNTGSINVVGTGGVGPYDFSIDGGTTFPVLDAASNLFGSLIAGTYNIQLRDANNCLSAIIPLNLTQPASAVGGTITPTNVLCFGGNTGSINVVGTGGVGPYDFSIDGGTTFPVLDAASNLFGSLIAGTYNVQVRDANNCITASIPVTLTQPTAIVPTITPTNILCFGGTTGSINVVGAGGTGPYDFSIDGGTTFPILDAASNLYTNLAVGTYNIQLRDANNCLSAIIPVAITEPAVVGATTTASNVLCFGGNTGSINVVGTGGVGPYDFSIDGGTTFPVLDAASNLFGSLIAGTYNIQLRDANNCLSAIIPLNLTQPASAVGGTITPTNVLCFGGNTGSINVVGTGGVGPYDFSIDGGTTFPVLDAASNLFGSLIAGTYNVQVRDANNCLSTITPVTITIDPAPTVDAGPAQTICGGNTVTLAGVIGGSATGGLWSGGTGTFNPNATTLNAIYTPSAAEVTAGTVTLTLTTTGPCAAVNDNVTITIDPAATVDAGPAQTICGGNTVTLAGVIGGSATGGLWSGGTGTFNPNATTLNAIYTPSATEVTAGTVTLTLTTTGPCAAVNDNVTITIDPAATVDAGPAQTICGDNTFTLAGVIGGSATGGLWSGGTGTFNPNATTLNAIYTPSAAEVTAGTVTLTLTTTGPCAAVNDNVTITINPVATTDAGSAQIICTGDDVTLAGVIGGSASSASWSGGAGTFAPNANDLNAVYTPTAGEVTAGSVTLILTTDDPDGAGPCTAAVDNVVITISSGATVDAGSPQTICAGNDATLAGSFTGAADILWTSPGDGSFNDATLPGAVYTPGAADIAAGTITLTITTGGPCAPEADDIIITINPAATVGAGAPQTICSGSTITLSGSFTGSATGILWTTNGNGTFSDDTDINAIYTPGTDDLTAGSAVLTITATGTCSGVTDNVTITINTAATVDAGLDQTICSGGATLAGSIGGSATSATWTGGTGTFNPNSSTLNAIYTPSAAEITAGSVTLTLTTDNPTGPCPAVADNVVITISTLPVAPTPGIDTWIGEVFTDAGPPVSAADFAPGKYRGYIDATDIDNTGTSSTYDVATDEFDLNFANGALQAPLVGPNICGSFSNNYSIRFRMQKTLPAGVYTVSVGSDDGVRLIVNGTTIINQFTNHAYTTFTGSFCSSGAGDDFVIEYYEAAGLSRVSFDYQIAPIPTVTTPVAVCVGSATAPTLTASSTDASVTSFNWYSDAGLTNQVGAGLTFTPTIGIGLGEIDLSTVASTSYFVTSDYGTCETAASPIVIDVVNGATIAVVDPTVCESAGAFDLTPFVTTTPIGGTLTFTSPHVTGTNFDPAGLSGPFVVDVDYGILTCVAPTTQMTVTVTNNSVVTVPALATTICQTNPIIDLTTLVSAVPAGGTFTFSNSAAITGNNFDPSLVTGPQTINVDYDFGAGSCAAPQTSFVINVLVNAAVVTSNTTVCPANGNVNLLPLVTGNPPGGVFTFSGTDVTGNTFNPSSHAGTTVPITVLYDAGGCTQVSGTIQITVRSATDVACVGGGGVNCFAFATSSPVIETRPTCANQNDGQLIFGVKGGTGTYVITLYDSLSIPIFTQAKIGSSAAPITFTNLSPSLTYFYKIDDGINVCTLPYSLPVQTTVMASATSFTNATCFGQPTGTAIINATGSQTGQYFYSADNGGNWLLFTPGNVVSGLPPNGTYNILVGESTTDACVANVSVTINNANPDLQISTTITDATCNNNDGKIVITPPTAPFIGGGGPYQYALSNGAVTTAFQTSTTFDELNGGVYSILVQDGLGCVKTITPVNVTFPGFVKFRVSSTNADCSNNGISGSVSVKILDIGGIYKVALSTDQFNEPDDADYVNYSGDSITFSPIVRGSYFVYVKSQTALCPTRSTAINIGGSYAVSFVIEPVCSDNKVSILISNITGEPNIPFSIVIFDKLDPLTAIEDIPVSAIPVTGGVRLDYDDYVFLQIPNKEYLIQINQVQSDFSCPPFLSPLENYITTSKLFAQVKPRTTAEDGESYPDEFTGKLGVINFAGGLIPYEVKIELEDPAVPGQFFETDFEEVQKNNNLQFEKLYENIPAGQYTIYIQDSLGCTLELQDAVPLDTDLFVPNIITPNGDGMNDFFFIRNLPTSDNKLNISDRWGVSVFSTNSYKNDWSGEDVSDGVYYYTLQTDSETRKGWIEVKKVVKP